MGYGLGIDLGTTWTAAAVLRDSRAEVLPLGDRSAAVPSVLLSRTDGTMLVGDAALRRGIGESDRLAREFKRRVGDTTPMIMGGTPYSADSLMSRLFRWVVDEATRTQGTAPEAIAVTHPANWGAYKLDLLRGALALADLPTATLLSEPEAAARYYAAQERVPPGTVVAVYDLGGGTFDATVLRKSSAAGFEVLGRPDGIERMGGIDIDAAVVAHVVRSLGPAYEALDADDPAVLGAVARLRQECVDAKEALSHDTDVSIAVLLPGVSTDVRLTRGELEGMIRPVIIDTVTTLKRAVDGAGVPLEEVSRVLLVGGSSRIPLVSQLVAAELGRPVAVDAHPKFAVALGAAMATAGDEVPDAPTVLAPVPPDPVATPLANPLVSPPVPPPPTAPNAIVAAPPPATGHGPGPGAAGIAGAAGAVGAAGVLGAAGAAAAAADDGIAFGSSWTPPGPAPGAPGDATGAVPAAGPPGSPLGKADPGAAGRGPEVVPAVPAAAAPPPAWTTPPPAPGAPFGAPPPTVALPSVGPSPMGPSVGPPPGGYGGPPPGYGGPPPGYGGPPPGPGYGAGHGPGPGGPGRRKGRKGLVVGIVVVILLLASAGVAYALTAGNGDDDDPDVATQSSSASTTQTTEEETTTTPESSTTTTEEEASTTSSSQRTTTTTRPTSTTRPPSTTSPPPPALPDGDYTVQITTLDGEAGLVGVQRFEDLVGLEAEEACGPFVDTEAFCTVPVGSPKVLPISESSILRLLDDTGFNPETVSYDVFVASAGSFSNFFALFVEDGAVAILEQLPNAG